MRATQQALLAMAATALMAQSIAAQEGIGLKIQSVFEETKTAKTEADYSSIVTKCNSLLEQTNNVQRKRYLTQLLAWGLNKRGELFAEQAVNSDNFDHAAELDAKALSDFEAAVTADPQRWKALHNRGVSYALLGRHEEAEADFSAAIKVNPQYSNSWFNRAELRYEKGNYPDALTDYSQTLELSPKDAGALRGRGLCYMELKKPENAVAEFTAAMEVEPHDDLLVQRGLSYQALRQWEQAATDFRQAIAMNKNSVLAYRSAAWLMSVCPDERMRNAALAIQAAEQAAQLETKQAGEISAPTYDALGAAYASSGNPTKAAQYAREALKLAQQLTPTDEAAVQQRLRLYEQGKPFRIAAAPTSAAQ